MILPTMQRAADILKGREDQKDLVNRIEEADPYPDKRFAPVIANWVAEHGVMPEEHACDIRQFKDLRHRLKSLRVPATNHERTFIVRQLLSRKPNDFTKHHSCLQEWNRQTSDILDPDRDLSDEGLPVQMRHGGYTMYRIDRKKHLRVPLVRNSMSWCVTKEYFGQYGGPPYYAIVRDRDRAPFCMVVPKHFDEDPDEAVRNSQNDGRLSPSDLRSIRPLLQRVLASKRYRHPYINGIHGVPPDPPSQPSAVEALGIIKDHALLPGEWPDGEAAVASDPGIALEYALETLRSPFPLAEPVLGKKPMVALEYATEVLRAPFPMGEKAISQDAYCAYQYANHIIRAAWPAGEKAIGQDAYYAYWYAKELLKSPFPAGERAIARHYYWAFHYATEVLKAPFPAGERAISKEPYYSVQYAKNVLRAPFPAGEKAIKRSPVDASQYAKAFPKNSALGGS